MGLLIALAGALAFGLWISHRYDVVWRTADPKVRRFRW